MQIKIAQFIFSVKACAMTLKRHVEREPKGSEAGKNMENIRNVSKKVSYAQKLFDGALKVKSKFTLKSAKCTVKGK